MSDVSEIKSQSTIHELERNIDNLSNLKNVINLYRSITDAKCDQQKVEKNLLDEIYDFGDSTYLQPATVHKLTTLKEDDRKNILEEMLDWEAYMCCKENEEQKKARSEIDTSLPIRNRCNPNNVIKVLSKSYQNNLHNTHFLRNDGFEENLEASSRDCDKINYHHKETNTKKQAVREKVLGNKSFEEKDYKKACQHYTNSLNLSPLLDSYNNRAMAYIRMENFSAALDDVNEVLKMDPHNEKALYRKVLCHKGMRMFEEALKEIEIHKSNNTRYARVSKEIKNQMSKLNGKKYNIRPRSGGSRKTFQIDISQLWVYANCDQLYLLEVDKMGCTRYCVCEYCTEEDQRNRNKTGGLRIKERDRWKPLTVQLLKEMGITNEQCKDFGPKPVSISNVDSEIQEKSKNEQSNRIAAAKLNDKFSLANVYPKYLKRGSYLSNHSEQVKVYPHLGGSGASEKGNGVERLLGDIKITEMQSPSDLTSYGCDDISAKLATYLKNTNSTCMKKDFDTDLNEDRLAAILKIIKDNFHLQKEWDRIYDILKAISSVHRFPDIIKSLDENTKNNLRFLVREATDSNLENAAKIGEKFVALFPEH